MSRLIEPLSMEEGDALRTDVAGLASNVAALARALQSHQDELDALRADMDAVKCRHEAATVVRAEPPKHEMPHASEAEMLALRAAVAEAGGPGKWAEANDVRLNYLTRVLNGHAVLGPKITKALGL